MRSEEMQAWCVKDVVGFMERVDLQGPGSFLYANVAKKDFMGLCEDDLATGLRMSSFAAKKVFRARGVFLGQ